MLRKLDGGHLRAFSSKLRSTSLLTSLRLANGRPHRVDLFSPLRPASITPLAAAVGWNIR